MEYNMKILRAIFLYCHLSSFAYILAQIYEENKPAFKTVVHKKMFNPLEFYRPNKSAI